jgi:D-beta-D-heptose 7-phosphate kinase/D-beta-D-heptose 1-phosphate adenosyltransferase
VEVFGVIGGSKNVADEAGRALRKCLRAAGIIDKGGVADPSRITTVKTRIIARHQHIVRVDRERREALRSDTEKRVLQSLLAALKSLDAIVLCDYDKGLITDQFACRVISACRRSNVPVFVGPKRSGLSAYRGALAIVCNAKEARQFVRNNVVRVLARKSQTLTNEKSVEEVGRDLLARFGCTAVLITRGEKGMSLFEQSSSRHLSIPATSFEVTYARAGQSGVDHSDGGRQAFDVTGAGDTVLSVLALAVAAGAPLPDAAILANTAAGVAVGKLGTASASLAELLRALDEISRWT